MKHFYALMFLGLFVTIPAAQATPASDALLEKYKSDGASNFDAARGKITWHKEVKSEDGEMQSCSTCHGSDLSKNGIHHKTQKVIEPMAASANPERFTDEKKVEKWFKRNCKDIWGRECTAQEKGDILKYLLSL